MRTAPEVLDAQPWSSYSDNRELIINAIKEFSQEQCIDMLKWIRENDIRPGALGKWSGVWMVPHPEGNFMSVADDVLFAKYISESTNK